MREIDFIITFCTVYNRTITEQQVKDYIYNPETNCQNLHDALDEIMTLNVITKDVQRGFCIFHLIKALRSRNQIPVYRWPANGIRKKILNVSSWCDEVQNTIYRHLAAEVRKLDEN